MAEKKKVKSVEDLRKIYKNRQQKKSAYKLSEKQKFIAAEQAKIQQLQAEKDKKQKLKQKHKGKWPDNKDPRREGENYLDALKRLRKEGWDI